MLQLQLARQSEIHRVKILGAFQDVPNIIEMATNKSNIFPLDRQHPKIIQLHKNVQELHTTLLKALPVLINMLIPGTFREVNRVKLYEWFKKLTLFSP